MRRLVILSLISAVIIGLVATWGGIRLNLNENKNFEVLWKYEENKHNQCLGKHFQAFSMITILIDRLLELNPNLRKELFIGECDNYEGPMRIYGTVDSVRLLSDETYCRKITLDNKYTEIMAKNKNLEYYPNHYQRMYEQAKSDLNVCKNSVENLKKLYDEILEKHLATAKEKMNEKL